MPDIPDNVCDCNRECPPLAEAGPVGPAGIGSDGDDGTDGVNAFTETTLSFIVPAVNSNVVITVADNDWMAAGQIILVGTGSSFAYFQVVGFPAASTVEIKNIGGTGAVVATTVLPAFSNVVVAGREGAAGSGSINLATQVTGTLPIANGGTGQTAATAAFDALAPSVSAGDLIVHDGTDNVRLIVGADGTTLVADSAEDEGVKWGALDLSLSEVSVTGELSVENGGTGLASLTAGTILIASGASSFDTIKWNLTATSDPTIADDNSEGYEVGSRWVNTSSGEEFVCVDNSASAAVWYSTTNSSAAGFSRTFTAAGSYVVQPEDTFVCVTSGTCAITLPDPATFPSAFLTIKHEGTDPSNPTITITASGGTTVEGTGAIVINIARGHVVLYKTSSTTWRILNRNTYNIIALPFGGTGTSGFTASRFVNVNSSGTALSTLTPLTVTANSGANSITPSTPAADTFDGAGQTYHTFASLDQTKWESLLGQIEALRDTVAALEAFCESFITEGRNNFLIA